MATHTTLLSPFDPVVWDRARARQLFNFDFMIQAYTPAAKRQFGYFPLPLLHDGEIIGRLDCKARRKDGIFEIRGIYLEDGVALTEDLVKAVVGAVTHCARWHRTPVVQVNEEVPEEIRNSINQSL